MTNGYWEDVSLYTAINDRSVDNCSQQESTNNGKMCPCTQLLMIVQSTIVLNKSQQTTELTNARKTCHQQEKTQT